MQSIQSCRSEQLSSGLLRVSGVRRCNWTTGPLDYWTKLDGHACGTEPWQADDNIISELVHHYEVTWSGLGKHRQLRHVYDLVDLGRGAIRESDSEWYAPLDYPQVLVLSNPSAVDERCRRAGVHKRVTAWCSVQQCSDGDQVCPTGLIR
jgi:hypothetical protein